MQRVWSVRSATLSSSVEAMLARGFQLRYEAEEFTSVGDAQIRTWAIAVSFDCGAPTPWGLLRFLVGKTLGNKGRDLALMARQWQRSGCATVGDDSTAAAGGQNCAAPIVSVKDQRRASRFPDCRPNRVRSGKDERNRQGNTQDTSPSFVTRLRSS